MSDETMSDETMSDETMALDILTGEEVEALLRGVPEQRTEHAELRTSTVQKYALGDGRGRVDTLLAEVDRVNARFCERLAGALRTYLGEPVVVFPEQACALPYGEFLRRLSQPVDLRVAGTSTPGDGALIVLERGLVAQALTTLFGGPSSPGDPARVHALSATERRVAERLRDIAVRACQTAWRATSGAHPTESEMEGRPAPIFAVADADQVAATRVRVEFGATGGVLHLCKPYAMLDSLRASAPDVAERAAGKQSQTTSGEHVAGADVELAGLLACTTITVRDLLDLERGDVVPIDLPAALIAEANGRPLFECGYGVVDGRYALRVQRVLRADDGAGEGGGGERA